MQPLQHAQGFLGSCLWTLAKAALHSDAEVAQGAALRVRLAATALAPILDAQIGYCREVHYSLDRCVHVAGSFLDCCQRLPSLPWGMMTTREHWQSRCASQRHWAIKRVQRITRDQQPVCNSACDRSDAIAITQMSHGRSNGSKVKVCGLWGALQYSCSR